MDSFFISSSIFDEVSLNLIVFFFFEHKRKIHSKHHEFKQPIGIVAVLAHPIESTLGNLIPTIIGPILMKEKHIITIMLWLFIRMIQTSNAHSGYDLPILNPIKKIIPFYGGSKFHEYHHLVIVQSKKKKIRFFLIFEIKVWS